jgi:UDP-MurNAc hydroxylase
MEIQFIGHASFSIATHGRKIVCDPWLSGKVFNDSWAQICTPAPVDWSTVDYLWISHEHPDHFHFPTLKSIPLVDKQRIVVLYQTHSSKRMIDALGKLGFQHVTELPLYRWKEIAPGIEVYCGSVGSMDSFLAVRSEGKCILNLNDCVLNPGQLGYIKSAVGHITTLFTQFSIANWVGNDSDELGGAIEKLHELRWQADIFKPDHIVPFASFVYFCNQENQRMNAWINTPELISRQGLPGLHFMYPGDVWDLQENEAASMTALARYTKDFAATMQIDPTPRPVDEEQLMKAARSCMDTFVTHYPHQSKKIPPLTIHVTDLDKRLSFEPATASVAIADTEPGNPCGYEMCSQAAWYMFNFSWGAGTLRISGMYRDRQRTTVGLHPFFYYQNKLSTQFLRFGNISDSSRTLACLWRKKWELAYRYIPAPAGLKQGAAHVERQ